MDITAKIYNKFRIASEYFNDDPNTLIKWLDTFQHYDTFDSKHESKIVSIKNEIVKEYNVSEQIAWDYINDSRELTLNDFWSMSRKDFHVNGKVIQ
jgi:hypothetical protein